MDFATYVDFSAPVTSVDKGLTATLGASIFIDGEGVVRGTWSLDGFELLLGGPQQMEVHYTGALSAVGGLSGPWSVWLGNGPFTEQASTLVYGNGQFTLTVDAKLPLGPVAVPLSFGPGGSTAGTPIHASQKIGSTGSDTIAAGDASAAFDGGAGIDTVVFGDARANYTVSHDLGGTWTVTHTAGSAATTTLAGIERLQFADSKLAIDIDGNGGKAYRLYQAAFDRVPDVPGLGYQMHDLDLGFPLSQVAANFIASPEFQSKFGTNLTDSQFVTLLYQHVLHRDPEGFEVTYHVEQELLKGYSRADVLTFFSESPENQLHLIGTIGNGMVYTYP